jgi:hypothetical protein
MKQIVFIIISALPVLSCNQSKNRQESREKIPDSLSQIVKSDFRIVDSSYRLPAYNRYLITTDTAYFFDIADSLHQRKEYLLRDENVEILDLQNGFALADYTMPSGKHVIGWLKLSDMQKILFTPPKIAN